MSNHSKENSMSMSRRDFLKIALMIGSTLATIDLAKSIVDIPVDSVLAGAGTGPYYYGTDTSWAVDTKGSNASNFPQNFYIGRTGVGELIYNDSAFYPDAADKAGTYFTHTYWDLKGPYYKFIGSRTPYEYGFAQGTKAASAWFSHYWANKIGGKTIFADIEKGKSDDPQSALFDGWRYFINGTEYVNKVKNRAVLNGFLDAITMYGSGFNPGVYTRTDLWQDWFGDIDYDPQRAYVVWLAGNACGFTCSPCGTCTTAKSEADIKFNTMKETYLGNYKTVIWQFYISECPAPDCADYDISIQNGYIRFSPVFSLYLPITVQGPVPMNASNAYPEPDQELFHQDNCCESDEPVNAYPSPETDQ